MKLSTRARYGTRALLDIASNGTGGPVLLRDIAQRQEISPLYLERVISPLIAAGVVRSTRGAHGGIRLARLPSEIKLNEVVRILEGSLAPVDCVDDPKVCRRSGFCVTRDVWGEVKQAMDGVLTAITLADLMERQKKKEPPSGTTMYHI
ncbi:MAG: Rrf2 family transcriptional regulator [Chloroflexota bacterium]